MLIGNFFTNIDRPTTLYNTKVTTITCQNNSQLCLRGDLLNQHVAQVSEDAPINVCGCVCVCVGVGVCCVCVGVCVCVCVCVGVCSACVCRCSDQCRCPDPCSDQCSDQCTDVQVSAQMLRFFESQKAASGFELCLDVG